MIPFKQKEKRGFENQGKRRKAIVKLLFKTFNRLSMTKVLSFKNQLPILKAALFR
jgi:hypothetical protein